MRSRFPFGQATTMRCAAFAMCLVASACGETAMSPASPSSASSGVDQTQARGGNQLPFSGSLDANEVDVAVPPNLMVEGTATGNGSHLGRFTATYAATVSLATGTATGTFTFIAANGDRLESTFVGLGVPTANPDIASIEEVATILSGTGRFAGATGAFTIHRTANLVTGASSGSFDGTLNLNH
jgi:hypothetical protein